MSLSGFSSFRPFRGISPLAGSLVLAGAFLAPILLLGSDQPATASAQVVVTPKTVSLPPLQKNERSLIQKGSFWSGLWDDLTAIASIDDHDTVARFDPDAAVHIEHFGKKVSHAPSVFPKIAPLTSVGDGLSGFSEDYLEPLLAQLADSLSAGQDAASDLYHDVRTQAQNVITDL